MALREIMLDLLAKREEITHEECEAIREVLADSTTISWRHFRLRGLLTFLLFERERAPENCGRRMGERDADCAELIASVVQISWVPRAKNAGIFFRVFRGPHL